MRCWAVLPIVLGLTSPVVAILNPLRMDFESFFPEYSNGLRLILQDEDMCGRIFARYRERQNGTEQHSENPSRPGHEDDDDDDRDPFGLTPDQLDKLSSAFRLDTLTEQLVECILEKTPELIKVRMASAQVLMGLTPGLLAVIGPQPWQTGVIASVGKRRLLAFLLAAGSPMLNPSLGSGSSLLDELLRRNGGGNDNHQRFAYPAWIYRVMRDGNVGGHRFWGSIARTAGWLVFYTLALASIANIGHLMYTLITRAALTITLSESWFLLLWVVIGVLIHGCGTLAVWLRIKHCPMGEGRKGDSSSYTNRIMPTAADDLGGRTSTSGSSFYIEVLPPGILSVLMTWLTAVCTVGQVLFGTLLFSSILFMSVIDAVTVVMRLLGSVVFCRLAMEYEIAMELRNTDFVNHIPKRAVTEQQQTKQAPLQPQFLLHEEQMR